MSIDDFERSVMAEKDAEIEQRLQNDENRKVQHATEEISRLEKVCIWFAVFETTISLPLLTKDLNEFQTLHKDNEFGAIKLQLAAKVHQPHFKTE